MVGALLQHSLLIIPYRTADVAANAPRFRRKPSTYVDAIHDLPAREELAPAQLYSTESGRLFHCGRIAIATVGLPARGKTLGVKTRVFHLGDYRRESVGPGQSIPDDYFFVNGAFVCRDCLSSAYLKLMLEPSASAASVLLRQKILKKCRDDIYHFLNHENGQIAIYDAVNPLAAGRRSLAKEFAKHDVETLFIESACTDERIIEENVRSVKISSPDYIGWSSEDAVKHYLSRMSAKIPHFETMEEPELNYIKAGTTSDEDSYKTDAGLSDQGRLYAEKMGQALLQHREAERLALIERGGPDIPLKPLRVWTSTRRRTVETAEWLYEQGYSVRQRTQLSQLNPGVCEKMSERRIRAEMPDEVAKHEADPYHHRYPRAESYHDLAVRLEPIILELERQQDDLLIIAHESVLRVLYGYLMACNATDIPGLSFPRNEIIEIIPASYNNESSSIPIPDLPPEIIPASPEDVKIPVPPSEGPSGTATPMNLDPPMMTPGNSRFGSPRKPATPQANGGSSPQEAGEGSLLLVERALRD
ncbi:MAG: hypothetical protein L6R42_000658 [Xanthoria sp. 1 TBL-2021]|nr:MAG: hypothetical protein L6R42_000658 [Xanthoria sp. 1 TBL-2021]